MSESRRPEIGATEPSASFSRWTSGSTRASRSSSSGISSSYASVGFFFGTSANRKHNDLRRVVSEDVDDLDHHQVLARLFVHMRIRDESETAILASPVRDPSLHERVVGEVPVDGP